MVLIDKIIYLFTKQDIYIGYSIDEVSKIINILNENNIKYTYRTVSNVKSRNKFTLEMVGMNKDYETQYTISVKQDDYEKAKYFINKIYVDN